MPLEWDEVKRRYAGGRRVPTVAGGKTLEVTGVDDAGVHIRGGRLWTATLEREHLERAARLVEEGRLSRLPVSFVEGYHELVAPERGTAVAHILNDFGYLD